MKKVASMIKIVAINLAITLLLFEAGSVMLYFFKTREIFYFRDRTRVQKTLEGFGESPGPESPSATSTLNWGLHPLALCGSRDFADCLSKERTRTNSWWAFLVDRWLSVITKTILKNNSWSKHSRLCHNCVTNA